MRLAALGAAAMVLGSVVIGDGAMGRAHAQVNSEQRAIGQEVIRERAEARGVSAQLMLDIADCETGGTWNPRVRGRLGERGPFQLLPGGELDRFYAQGYTDPESWYQAADFTARRLAGGATHGRSGIARPTWSCPTDRSR